MAKLVTNTIKKPFTFVLHFKDGKPDETVTITADSFNAAVLGLPRFADVGKYKYELKK